MKITISELKKGGKGKVHHKGNGFHSQITIVGFDGLEIVEPIFCRFYKTPTRIYAHVFIERNPHYVNGLEWTDSGSFGEAMELALRAIGVRTSEQITDIQSCEDVLCRLTMELYTSIIMATAINAHG